MHPNPMFRKTSREANIAFVRQRSFGVLAVNADNAPLISHIPFQLSEDGTYLEAHIARGNPIFRMLSEPIDAVIAVSGGDAYISPDWYGVEDQVPTWNYVAVHLRGKLRLLPDDELHGVLVRISANMEERLAPKKPWKIDKMDADAYARMTRQIAPVMMDISDIQGTWKLSQNKPAEVRHGAMQGAKGSEVGAQVDEIVKLMAGLDGA